MNREVNTQYVLSLSYGKDSLACLEAIRLLDLPLDRIIHAEVWATDTIPADLPPMVEFKAKADAIIKERYGITVEHVSAVKRERERDCCPTSGSFTHDSMAGSIQDKSMDSLWCEGHGATQDSKPRHLMPLQRETYERMFYHVPKRKPNSKMPPGSIYGFATLKMPWCNKELKMRALNSFLKAPLHKELIQILCNTSGLPQTSPRELSDILDPV